MKKRVFILTMLTVFTLTITGCQTSQKDSTVQIPTETAVASQMNADAPVSAAAPTAPVSDSSSSGITDADAKEIALADAKLEASKISHIWIEKDYDDGVAIYDIEFYAENKEYDYEIDAATGEIRSRDFDIEHDFSSKQTTGSISSNDLLSEQEAAKIVLTKVEGATMQNLHITLDRDDGQDIYEGEIHYNGIEYDFELNAKTGDILEWSQEREDN